MIDIYYQLCTFLTNTDAVSKEFKSKVFFNDRALVDKIQSLLWSEPLNKLRFWILSISHKIITGKSQN